MKKILLILALSASFCGAITNGVYATAGGFLNESARLSDSDWTNSTAWYAFPASLNPLSALDASPVRSNGVYAGSGCGTFDGLADRVAGPVLNFGTNDYRVSFWFRATGVQGMVIDGRDGFEDGFRALWQSGSTLRASHNAINADLTGLTTNVWYNILIEKTGSTLSVRRVGQSPVVNTNATNAISVTTTVKIGGVSPLFFHGQIADVSVDGYFRYPLSSRWGTTIHDVSGNGNHGTLTTGVGGQATFWGGTQTNVHWNLTKGHAAWTDGTNTTRVPYLANMSGPAATNVVGSTLIEQRPASFVHNKAETTIDGFSYSNLITNALWTVTTNASAFITEARQ